MLGGGSDEDLRELSYIKEETELMGSVAQNTSQHSHKMHQSNVHSTVKLGLIEPVGVEDVRHSLKGKLHPLKDQDLKQASASYDNYSPTER